MTEILLALVKALAVVMFSMNVAVVLTWADRRQGAMFNDRVGPNRAVIFLPARLVQALALLPALAATGLVLTSLVASPAIGPDRTGRAMLFTQLAILFLWLTGLFIAGRIRNRGPRGSVDLFFAQLGDPRRFFYAGLAAHLVTLGVGAALRATPLGVQLREVAYHGAPMLFLFAVVGGALYAVASLQGEEKVGLRLLGLLHPAADGLKSLFKEDLIPPRADRLLHGLAPMISLFPALVVLAVVPFGDTLCFESKDGNWGSLLPNVPAQGVCHNGAVPLQVMDANVGLLFFFALAGTGIVGAALAGWASNSKFSLLGGLRAASQMVSYEVTLGLTLIGALMVYGTLRVDEMVRWQANNAWGIFVQPLAFVLFFAAAIAEAKRTPFDLPEGESELVAGYFTEYSGMKFAMFFFSEYIAIVSSSAVMAALFFGGWHLPFLQRDGLHVAVGDTVLIHHALSHGWVVAMGAAGFVAKVLTLCWLQLAIRWTLPRFRYDQLMRLGWRKLLPTSLFNILVTGLVILMIQSASTQFLRGLAVAADVTQLILAIAGAVGLVLFVRFILRPAEHQAVTASTAAQFANARGGTQSARMGA